MNKIWGVGKGVAATASALKTAYDVWNLITNMNTSSDAIEMLKKAT